jgi:peptide methionine sulfoxide reductase msrA/msrB
MTKAASLTPIILDVMQEQGTERPFSGEYDQFGESGTYLCRQCGLALFRSATKFHSGCGWPSFDEEITGAIERRADQDGKRVEIRCSRCHGHLGHVFEGEHFTTNNTRHCVNSLSLDFVADLTIKDTKEAIYAAGCFWGVEYYFKKLPGVLKTQVGYTGGKKQQPTYQDVCSGSTGHYEAVRVVYNPELLDYKKLTQYFFEIHDAKQHDGQGPDIGEQYKSVIFYYDDQQKMIAEDIIKQLKNMNYNVATKLLPVTTFWPAEGYHQDYYVKQHKQPYCHRYEKIF